MVCGHTWAHRRRVSGPVSKETTYLRLQLTRELRGVASASAVGFSHQNWFRAGTYQNACNAFYRSALGNSVSDK